MSNHVDKHPQENQHTVKRKELCYSMIVKTTNAYSATADCQLFLFP